MRESLFGGCRNSLFAKSHGPYLTGQTDFSETDQTFLASPIAKTRDDSEHRRQINGCLTNSQAADYIHEYIFGSEPEIAVSLQHRKPQCQAILLNACCEPLWMRRATVRDERLYFNEQGSTALPCDRHDAARLGHRIAGQKIADGLRT